jgi:beta-glucosidase
MHQMNATLLPVSGGNQSTYNDDCCLRACMLQSAGALGIMCAYNAVNGTASCASAPLLKKLLRGNMGFDGYVVSDW